MFCHLTSPILILMAGFAALWCKGNGKKNLQEPYLKYKISAFKIKNAVYFKLQGNKSTTSTKKRLEIFS